jgi:hypothetical protein
MRHKRGNPAKSHIPMVATFLGDTYRKRRRLTAERFLRALCQLNCYAGFRIGSMRLELSHAISILAL